MNHSALKTEINEKSAAAKAQRREATQLIIEGRKLRREGRALGAEKPDPDQRGVALLEQGWDNHSQGRDLLWEAEDGRDDRRHLHLAAALLNGRTYKQCEPTINEQKTGKASASCIARLIEPHLPKGVDAMVLATDWLDGVEGGINRVRTLHLLARLDELIAKGGGDGEEADRVRDYLDHFWKTMPDWDAVQEEHLRLKEAA